MALPPKGGSGLGAAITRRDFLNGVPIAVGGAAAGGLLPEFIAAALRAVRRRRTRPDYPPAADRAARNHPAASKPRTLCAIRLPGRIRHPAPRRRQTTARARRATIWSSLAAASAGLPRRISTAPGTGPPASSFSTTMTISAVMPSVMNSPRRPLGADEWRNVFDRQSAALQRRGGWSPENARHRSRRADEEMRRSEFLRLARPGARHILRSGNLRRRQARVLGRRRRWSEFLAASPLPPAGTRRHCPHRGSEDRLFSRPVVRPKRNRDWRG